MPGATNFVGLLSGQVVRSALDVGGQPTGREFPVEGLPSPSGKGKVDYVLWDDDGRPLGLVEAKRTTRDAVSGQQQAKLYADAQLLARTGSWPAGHGEPGRAFRRAALLKVLERLSEAVEIAATHREYRAVGVFAVTNTTILNVPATSTQLSPSAVLRAWP